MSGCHVPMWDEIKVFMDSWEDLKKVINQHATLINKMVEHESYQVNENIHIGKKLDEIEKKVKYLEHKLLVKDTIEKYIKYYGKENLEEIFKLNNKRTGLSFEEALKQHKNGRKIKRPGFHQALGGWEDCESCGNILDLEDILANDWYVVI